MIEQLIIFLKNEIVINWIAPIVVALIPTILVKLVFDRQKSKNIISTIKVANNKLVDVVRPFFIQEITFNIQMLEDIRKAIVIEYSIEDNMLYTLQQLKEIIILDIAETRFLTEEKKNTLMNCVYKEFEKVNSEDLKIIKDIDKYNEVINMEYKKLRKANINLFLSFYIFMISAIIIYFASKVDMDLFDWYELEILFSVTFLVILIVVIVILAVTYQTTNKFISFKKSNNKYEEKEVDKNNID